MTGDNRVSEVIKSFLRTAYAIVDLLNPPETATARMPRVDEAIAL